MVGVDVSGGLADDRRPGRNLSRLVSLDAAAVPAACTSPHFHPPAVSPTSHFDRCGSCNPPSGESSAEDPGDRDSIFDFSGRAASS
jgi:hypothetical protein